MTSPLEDKKPADDGAPSDDDVPLVPEADQGENDDAGAPAVTFTMLGGTAEACGPDGCSAP